MYVVAAELRRFVYRLCLYTPPCERMYPMSAHGRVVLLLLAASLQLAGCRSTTGLEQGQNVRTASSAPTHAPTSTIALPATPTAIAEVEPPSDFGFVFTALSCYRTQLDTFAGTYTRDLVTSA